MPDTASALGPAAAASILVALPSGEMTACAIDEWTLNHLAMALNTHAAGQRAAAYAVPPRLPLLARWVTHAVRARQGTTPLEPSAPTSQDAGMRPIPFVLTPEDVADLLSVSVRTVTRLVDDGELQAIKVGTKRRIRREALLEYLDQLTEAAAA